MPALKPTDYFGEIIWLGQVAIAMQVCDQRQHNHCPWVFQDPRGKLMAG